jgi:predicted RNA-binding Zn-ribbon protein involved in translation (DUF1610 family)
MRVKVHRKNKTTTVEMRLKEFTRDGAPCKCPKCGTRSSMGAGWRYVEEGKRIPIMWRCRSCDSIFQPIEEEEAILHSMYPCPRCKQGMLKIYSWLNQDYYFHCVNCQYESPHQPIPNLSSLY